MITVIICTHNRAMLLQECLLATILQTQHPDTYKILVVENCCTDNTALVVSKFKNQYDNVQLVSAPIIGLSHARNTGWQNANTDWVIYLDDDAKPHPDFIEQALYTINNFDFDCFGGLYHAWYKYPKPKWFDDTWASNGKKTTSIDLIPTNLFVDGGIMAIKRDILQKMNGFTADLGMSGNKIAYGEEVLLQIRMLKQGYKIGFNPDFEMDHLVAPYKYAVWWWIKSYYAHGRDAWNTFDMLPSLQSLPQFYKSITRLFLSKVKQNIFKLKQPNYYWQNFLLDTLKPIAHELGIRKGAKMLLKRNNK